MMIMTKKHITHVFIFIVLLSMVFAACSRKINPDIEDTPPRDPAKSYIAFFNYSLKSADAEVEATLVDIILTEGKIKSKTQLAYSEDGKLIFETLDKNGEIVSSKYYPNPLAKSVEYVNNQGNLERKLIFQSEAEFTIRTQLSYEEKAIVLSLDMGNNKKKELNRQEL
jgi:hypothetical protein